MISSTKYWLVKDINNNIILVANKNRPPRKCCAESCSEWTSFERVYHETPIRDLSYYDYDIRQVCFVKEPNNDDEHIPAFIEKVNNQYWFVPDIVLEWLDGKIVFMLRQGFKTVGFEVSENIKRQLVDGYNLVWLHIFN